MKHSITACAFLALITLGACQTAPQPTSGYDMCGASKYRYLVGGPSSAATSLKNVPKDTRHYGQEERVEISNTLRLNFIHSGTALEAVSNPKSTVTRVFCG